MEYALIAVPAAPVRRKANHRKEMVSQLLFGEAVKVLNSKGDLWVKVRSLHDGYEGWITYNLLLPVDKSIAIAESAMVTTGMMNMITVDGKKMNIPFGSTLPFFENGKGRLGKSEFEFAGQYRKRNEQKPGEELVKQFTSAWINAPYLWGGRTPLGIDCSGFVQVNYKMMGIDLPRDAWQQAQTGKAVEKLKDVQTGDLAFFNDKDEIVHVGILLNEEQIIHASGRVRIDMIDKKGIINSDTGKRTHKLEAIRRLW